MVALQSGPIVSPCRLVTTLVGLLQICSGELTGQIYKSLLDVSHSTTATYATFSGDFSFHCLQVCNLDADCKGVFHDGKLCSMVRYGTSISKAVPPAPMARFHMKEKTCPATFDHDPTQHFCHKFVDLHLTFTDAISYCKTLGAHLVVVNNEEENSHIENKLRSIAASSTLRHVFLDGTDKMTGQVWKRHTGEPVPYTNFHPLEGRDAGTQCASFDPYRNFMWSDLICNYPCRFICEIDIY